jgi:hypothetical protein
MTEGEKKMTAIIIAALCGILVGGGVASGVAISVVNRQDKAVQEAAAVAGAKAASAVVDDLTRPAVNMTEPDLLKIACSAEHIDKHGDLLCREMFCRMQTRGIDAKASGTECEQISNIGNKQTMMKTCDVMETPERQKFCYDFFDKRL